VRAVREDVAQWKEFIAYAQQVYEDLPQSVACLEHRKKEPVEGTYAPREAFVGLLAKAYAIP